MANLSRYFVQPFIRLLFLIIIWLLYM